MNQWWQVWDRWFSKDDCDRIVASCVALPAAQGHIGYGGLAKLNDSWRKSTIRWVRKTNPDFSSLFANLESLFNDANSAAFGFSLNTFREIQFTEYHESVQGKYDWHEDISWTGSSQLHRKLSLVVQLSDPADYEGGKLELDESQCMESPGPELIRRGSVIVFPSFLKHRVTPVTRGIRYSLVSWHEGPKFR